MRARCGLFLVVAGEQRPDPGRALRLGTGTYHRRLPTCVMIGFVLLMHALGGASGSAQNTDAPKDGPDASLLSTPPRSWVVDAAANELIALHHKNSYLRYRMETVNEKGNQTRDVVESEEGTVARLILRDGKPLTEEQDAGERQRLNDMIASPAAYAKHVKNGESEKKMADTLVPLMADAMIYTYTPGQPQTGRNTGTQEIVLDYKPNPKWNPPNTEAQALTGLEGRVWIDAKTRYVVRMEGTIFRGVNFGWGMLAHIYPGGKLVLNQSNAGGNRWIFTDFSMQLNVRALMVKTLNIHSIAKASGFQTLGPLTYQDAVRLLLSTPLPNK
jgi:hypothetical protein